jgi:hypothetical protein
VYLSIEDCILLILLDDNLKTFVSVLTEKQDAGHI